MRGQEGQEELRLILCLRLAHFVIMDNLFHLCESSLHHLLKWGQWHFKGGGRTDSRPLKLNRGPQHKDPHHLALDGL